MYRYSRYRILKKLPQEGFFSECFALYAAKLGYEVVVELREPVIRGVDEDILVDPAALFAYARDKVIAFEQVRGYRRPPHIGRAVAREQLELARPFKDEYAAFGVGKLFLLDLGEGK